MSKMSIQNSGNDFQPMLFCIEIIKHTLMTIKLTKKTLKNTKDSTFI